MKLYNSVLENLILPVGDLLLGTQYIAALKKWRSIQELSTDELESLQKQKLQKILHHAIKNIPFYKNTGSGIKDFPFQTKALIRENLNSLLWHPEKLNDLVCEKGSGSSGIQGAIYMSRQEQSNVQALQTYFWEWAGYSIGLPMLQTGMTLKRGSVKSIKDKLFKTRYQSAFDLDESEVVSVLKKIRDTPVRFFGGYASSLFVYAQIAEKNKIDGIHFDSVISWGDKMFAHYRSLIEHQFSTKVYDTYGTTEGFMIAGQKDLEYYYIVSPHVYLELLNENGDEVPDGEMGFVVVTSLDAYEMPLIRYYLGDMAVKLPRNQYPMNRSLNFPLLERIVGRDTDIVRTPSGKSMIVHFFTAIFEHVSEIKQFRVIQENLESITVEYIPQDSFQTSVLDVIRMKINNHLNEEFLVKFVEVDLIPPTPSGKPQIVVSRVGVSGKW